MNFLKLDLKSSRVDQAYSILSNKDFYMAYQDDGILFYYMKLFYSLLK